MWVLSALLLGAGTSEIRGAEGGVESKTAPDAIWQRDLDEAGAQSMRDGRLLLLHLWAPENESSRKMEREFYGDPTIAKQLSEDYLCVPINGLQHRELLEQLEIPVVFPTDLVLRTDGVDSEVLNVQSGAVPPEIYLKSLRAVARKYRRPVTSAAPTAPSVQSIPEREELPSEIPPSPMERTGEPSLTPVSPPSHPIASSMGTPSPLPPTHPESPASVEPRSGNIPTSPAQPLTSEDASEDPFDFDPSPTSPVTSPILPDRFAESASPTPEDPSLTIPEFPELSTTDAKDVDEPAGEAPPVPPSPVLPTPFTSGESPESAPSPPWSQSQPEVSPVPGIAPSESEVSANTQIAAAAPIPGFTPEESEILRKAPPLALDGYSPVTVTTSMRWVRGKVQYGVIHRGRTYLFHTEDESQMFRTDPERYAPALSGYDVVAAVHEQKLIPGIRGIAARVDGRIWLFTSEANYDAFAEAPEKYMDAAEQIIQKSEQQAAREARLRSDSLFR
ncbi:MAG: hypothetical protein Q4C47_08510 [Planctomycetia bacterium]|nr:hypothetical protein [Planctomycetia bacterium]